MVPDPGIYHDVPFTVYQSWRAWNPSTIKVLIDDSPMAMRHVMEQGSESTDSMDLGTATHLAVFQPELLTDRIVVWPEGRRQGKKWDEFEAANQGRIILTASQYNACLHARDSVRGHKPSAELLGVDGRTEVAIVWDDCATGARCKGRIDWLTDGFIADLKTSNDPKPRPFTFAAIDYGYYISMAAYLDGLWSLGHQAETAHFIVVGNKPWHDVVRYDMSPASLRAGLRKWQDGLARALECERLQRWPGCAPEPIMFELPEWAMGAGERLVVAGQSALEE